MAEHRWSYQDQIPHREARNGASPPHSVPQHLLYPQAVRAPEDQRVSQAAALDVFDCEVWCGETRRRKALGETPSRNYGPNEVRKDLWKSLAQPCSQQIDFRSGCSGLCAAKTREPYVLTKEMPVPRYFYIPLEILELLCGSSVSSMACAADKPQMGPPGSGEFAPTGCTNHGNSTFSLVLPSLRSSQPSKRCPKATLLPPGKSSRGRGWLRDEKTSH